MYLAFCEIDSSVLEVLLKYLDTKVFEHFFMYHGMAFAGLVASLMDRGEAKTMIDENKVYNLKQGVAVACKYLLREAQIKEEGVLDKITNIRQTNAPVFEEHIQTTLKGLLYLNYSERIKDMLVEQILMLIMLSPNRQELLILIRHTVMNHVPQYASTVDGMFVEISNISIERPNIITWRKKFGDLIEWITTAKSTPTTPF